MKTRTGLDDRDGLLEPLEGFGRVQIREPIGLVRGCGEDDRLVGESQDRQRVHDLVMLAVGAEPKRPGAGGERHRLAVGPAEVQEDPPRQVQREPRLSHPFEGRYPDDAGLGYPRLPGPSNSRRYQPYVRRGRKTDRVSGRHRCERVGTEHHLAHPGPIRAKSQGPLEGDEPFQGRHLIQRPPSGRKGSENESISPLSVWPTSSRRRRIASTLVNGRPPCRLAHFEGREDQPHPLPTIAGPVGRMQADLLIDVTAGPGPCRALDLGHPAERIDEARLLTPVVIIRYFHSEHSNHPRAAACQRAGPSLARSDVEQLGRPFGALALGGPAPPAVTIEILRLGFLDVATKRGRSLASM